MFIDGSFSGGLVNQYYLLACSVIFYYDFILTLPQEIKHIWSSKFNKVNLLVIALRYTTAIGYIPVLVLTFAPTFAEQWLMTSLICCAVYKADLHFSGGLKKLPGILGIICQSFTMVFLIIRLYAIFEMRRRILFVTVPFGLLTIVLSSLALGTAEILTVSLTGRDAGTTDGHSDSLHDSSFCFPTPNPNFARNDSLFIYRLSYIANISFDTLVFILAIFRMGRMRRAGLLYRSQSSIVWILFRDGIVLYAILTISNLFNFVIFLLYFNRELSGDSVGPVPIAYFKHFFVVSSGTSSEMTHTLSVILVSRMIFNLREVGTQIGEGTEEWRSRIERGVGEA